MRKRQSRGPAGMPEPLRVCVVGGGVVGLCTALACARAAAQLQRARDGGRGGAGGAAHGEPPLQVTVVADAWSPQTTSDGAGALWRPFLTGATPAASVMRWARATLHFLRGIVDDGAEDAADTKGVTMVSGFEYFIDESPAPEWAAQLPQFRKATAAEVGQANLLRESSAGAIKDGWRYWTVMVECTRFLPWLMSELRDLGARFETRRLGPHDLEELRGSYDVVCNCCGPRSWEVLPGGKAAAGIVPVRGQTVLVHAPHVSQFRVDVARMTYVLPRASGDVVCGGTAEEGTWNTEPSEETARDILARCFRLMPQLETRGAVVKANWAGLRPARPEGVCLRLEDPRDDRRGFLVHNFGHGGCGVTLAWGCALDVVELISSALVARRTRLGRAPTSKL